MRSLEVTATWHEEEEDVEVDDIEIRKHSINGRDDLSESSSDEATGRKIARRKNGGKHPIFTINYTHIHNYRSKNCFCRNIFGKH